EIAADFEHFPIFEQRLHGCERRALLDLAGRDVAGEQASVAAVAALAVGEGNVAGFVRRERQRETAQRGLHRVDTAGLGNNHDPAAFARASDPGLEPLEAAHHFVAGAIELGVARRCRACDSARLRRELGFRLGRPPRRGILRLERRTRFRAHRKGEARLLGRLRLAWRCARLELSIWLALRPPYPGLLPYAAAGRGRIPPPLPS